MAQDTTLAHGKPGIASFASESYGGPGEPRYGEGPATTTHHTVLAGADLDLPIYSVVSLLLGASGYPVLALHDPSATGVEATGTLTVSSTGPVNAETFVVGAKTYTFKTALSTGPAVANEILLSATPATQAAYIAAAINGTTSVGSSSATVANAEAHATVSGAVVTLHANVSGDEGNAVVLTESATNVAASGSGTLAGGSDEFDIKAFGILACPVVMSNGASMSVPIYREGMWDMAQLNWHALYITDEQKLNAFTGGPSPNLFIQKKKFTNDQISF